MQAERTVRDALRAAPHAERTAGNAPRTVRDAERDVRGAHGTVRNASRMVRSALRTVRDACTTARGASRAVRGASRTVRDALRTIRSAFPIVRDASGTARSVCRAVRGAFPAVRNGSRAIRGARGTTRCGFTTVRGATGIVRSACRAVRDGYRAIRCACGAAGFASRAVRSASRAVRDAFRAVRRASRTVRCADKAMRFACKAVRDASPIPHRASKALSFARGGARCASATVPCGGAAALDPDIAVRMVARTTCRACCECDGATRVGQGAAPGSSARGPAVPPAGPGIRRRPPQREDHHDLHARAQSRRPGHPEPPGHLVTPAIRHPARVDETSGAGVPSAKAQIPRAYRHAAISNRKSPLVGKAESRGMFTWNVGVRRVRESMNSEKQVTKRDRYHARAQLIAAIIDANEAVIIRHNSSGELRVLLNGLHFPGPTWTSFSSRYSQEQDVSTANRDRY
jgi:hypothetical protein